jgi:hypothetical protein
VEEESGAVKAIAASCLVLPFAAADSYWVGYSCRSANVCSNRGQPLPVIHAFDYSEEAFAVESTDSLGVRNGTQAASKTKFGECGHSDSTWHDASLRKEAHARGNVS